MTPRFFSFPLARYCICYPQLNKHEVTNMLVGILLVILGVLILLDKLNIITGGAFDYFWPAVIIAVGIWMIAGDKKKRIK